MEEVACFTFTKDQNMPRKKTVIAEPAPKTKILKGKRQAALTLDSLPEVSDKLAAVGLSIDSLSIHSDGKTSTIVINAKSLLPTIENDSSFQDPQPDPELQEELAPDSE
jgi:hypothetical protein